ncbi:MAG: DMT family transporter [Propionibacteriaceae bacterium]|nr:DMT family transporter [Propionibacteriaceae bacterium]
MLLAVVLNALAGALIPVQTAINSRLSGRLGAILPASLVSFAVGSAGLGLAVLATGTSVPWAETARTQPWWIWVGGACGLVFLTLNIVLLPRIGAAATVVLPLVGQVLAGLVIDLFGAFDTDVRPLTVVRAIGGVLVIVGAALVNLVGRRVVPAPDAESGGTDLAGTDVPDAELPDAGPPASDPAASTATITPTHSRPHLVLWVVGVLAGSLGAVQTAVNGRLTEVMGSGLASALVSFLVGTAGLVLINVATRQRVRRVTGVRPWMLLGGLLGATFVLANAVNAPRLGTSLAVSAALLGQVLMGLVVDHNGHFGIARRPVTALRLAGAALVVLGVALVRSG